MKRNTAIALVSVLVLGSAGPAPAAQMFLAQAAAPAAKPGAGEATAVKLRGTIAAIDKEKQIVTLKGPKGRTVDLRVEDKAKLDAVKVGDPVLATYVESVAIQVKKAGSATPGVVTQEGRVTSKPGETPAGAVGRQMIITGTITAIDAKQGVVTVKGPKGGTRKIKVDDPKNLEGVKVGDLVELTLSQALAISLDKPAK
jgi:Cu/Ag efflux protein CusF